MATDDPLPSNARHLAIISDTNGNAKGNTKGHADAPKRPRKQAETFAGIKNVKEGGGRCASVAVALQGPLKSPLMGRWRAQPPDRRINHSLRFPPPGTIRGITLLL